RGWRRTNAAEVPGGSEPEVGELIIVVRWRSGCARNRRLCGRLGRGAVVVVEGSEVGVLFRDQFDSLDEVRPGDLGVLVERGQQVDELLDCGARCPEV